MNGMSDGTNKYAEPQNAPPRIYADFHNADRKGRVRLNTQGALEDFRAIGVGPTVGMHVLLYDTEESCTEGIVEHDEIEGWIAQIDWEKLRPEQ
jgi:hypothetical protein